MGNQYFGCYGCKTLISAIDDEYHKVEIPIGTKVVVSFGEGGYSVTFSTGKMMIWCNSCWLLNQMRGKDPNSELTEILETKIQKCVLKYLWDLNHPDMRKRIIEDLEICIRNFRLHQEIGLISLFGNYELNFLVDGC